MFMCSDYVFLKLVPYERTGTPDTFAIQSSTYVRREYIVGSVAVHPFGYKFAKPICVHAFPSLITNAPPVSPKHAVPD